MRIATGEVEGTKTERNPHAAATIGSVEAPDAQSAIKLAIEKYAITNAEHQKRLAAYRIS